MKNFSDIQTLLDRYWDGETTLEEERALKAYFASGEIDERFRSVAPLFQVLRQEKLVNLTVKAGMERSAPTVPLRVRRFPKAYFWAAAASFALLLTAGWWWLQQPVQVEQPVANVQPQPVTPQETPAIPTATAQQKTISPEKPDTPAVAQKTIRRHKKGPAVRPIDPETEAAMEEIKAALALVSSKIRKGQHEAAKGAVHLESIDRVFKKKEG